MIQPGSSNTQFHPNPDPIPRLHAAGLNALSLVFSMSCIKLLDLGHCVGKTQFRRPPNAILLPALAEVV